MPVAQVNVPYFLQNTDEQLVPEVAEIEGKIPPWLRGSVLVAAPGIFDLPNGSFNHWLDGLAILALFEIGPTSVKFSKRFIQSEAYKKAVKAGKPRSVEMGTNPFFESKKGILSKLKPFGPYNLSDNCAGTVCSLTPSDTLLLSDTSYFYGINPKTLDILEQHNFQKTFSLTGMSPYPLKDEDSGVLYNVGSCISSTASLKYQILRLSPQTAGGKELGKKFQTICSIPSRWFSSISLLRCFSMSKNYIVFVELPVVVNLVKLAASNLKGYSVRDWIEFKEGELNRFYLIEKATGKLKKVEIYSEQPFKSVLSLNAYEEGDLLIFDCVTTRNLNQLDKSYLKDLRQCPTNATGDQSSIQRFIIPLLDDIKHYPENCDILAGKPPSIVKTAQALKKQDCLYLIPHTIHFNSEGGIDFGHINLSFIGKRYKHFFATPGACSMNSKYFGSLCKLNVETGRLETWTPKEEGYLVTHPHFISKLRPGKIDDHFGIYNCSTSSSNGQEMDDDDGIVIAGVVTKRKEDRNYFVFIDGKSFKEVGRCWFNEKIPYWISPTFMPNYTEF